MRGKATGVGTLAVVVTTLHAGASGQGRLPKKPRLLWNAGNHLSDRAALFRDALLPPLAWGRGDKRSPKNCQSHSPWPVCRGWRGSHPSSKNKKKHVSTKGTTVTFGVWNVRTLLDCAGTDRPDRRTALIASELARYNIEIAALSETRLAEEGQLSEWSAGYTFFWIGRGQDKRREEQESVLPSNLIWSTSCLHPWRESTSAWWQSDFPSPESAMPHWSARMPRRWTTPKMSKPSSMRTWKTPSQPYPGVTNSSSLVTSTPESAETTRRGRESWEGMVIGNCNSNGLLLLETSVAHGLLFTNSIFHLPNCNKTSWMHPCSKHWHLIDYVIVRQRDRQDVRVTKTMCVTECWTDHRLLICNMNIRIQPSRRPQSIKVPKRLDILQAQVQRGQADTGWGAWQQDAFTKPRPACRRRGRMGASPWCCLHCCRRCVRPYHPQAPGLVRWQQ